MTIIFLKNRKINEVIERKMMIIEFDKAKKS